MCKTSKPVKAPCPMAIGVSSVTDWDKTSFWDPITCEREVRSTQSLTLEKTILETFPNPIHQ